MSVTKVINPVDKKIFNEPLNKSEPSENTHWMYLLYLFIYTYYTHFMQLEPVLNEKELILNKTADTVCDTVCNYFVPWSRENISQF